jgi:ABC-type cobalamin transport system permease subunit
LLKCWWWRRVDVVAIVVLVGTTVASVGHVMIVKRFGTQIDIEIRDSELYASRYIDD